jgi:hypothetical protein
MAASFSTASHEVELWLRSLHDDILSRTGLMIFYHFCYLFNPDLNCCLTVAGSRVVFKFLSSASWLCEIPTQFTTLTFTVRSEYLLHTQIHPSASIFVNWWQKYAFLVSTVTRITLWISFVETMNFTCLTSGKSRKNKNLIMKTWA